MSAVGHNRADALKLRCLLLPRKRAFPKRLWIHALGRPWTPLGLGSGTAPKVLPGWRHNNVAVIAVDERRSLLLEDCRKRRPGAASGLGTGFRCLPINLPLSA